MTRPRLARLLDRLAAWLSADCRELAATFDQAKFDAHVSRKDH